MRILTALFMVVVALPGPAPAAELAPQPLADPIPEKIMKGGVVVAAEEFLQLPRTRDSSAVSSTNNAWARIQYMTPIPDGSRRLVINDLRGILYLTDESGREPVVFLDLREQDVGFDDSMFPNETGLAGFAFHPQFAASGTPGFGKFYTAYSTPSDTGLANYLDDAAESHESVIREWTAEDPSADRFAGASREIFRVGQFDRNHNIGTLAFNPAATPGDSDYGMLFASFGDGGGANDPREHGQATATPLAAIIRIDPLGGGDNAAYAVPADNPFVDREGFAPEIWAYGLRHPQGFSFDVNGVMYICDIGQNQVEEVNIGVKGANYGWRLREGAFATAFGIGGVRPNPVYPRPPDDQPRVYPVAQYDHDEGNAIGSGFVYRGNAIAELQGSFLFGDLVTGRVFYIDTADLEPGAAALIQELSITFLGSERNVADAVGFPNTYSSGNRADLRLGIDSQGEIYLLTKGDGKVRKLVPGP